MRGRVLLAIGIFFILLSPSITSAHDQKEYNILITEDGLTPASINPGILVETDTLFFRNVDERQDVQHRILVDADGDGAFEGIDDFSTEWISSSCELNETGQKVDDSCNQHALILLDPSNRLLPGNISMIHQIKEYNETVDIDFYINFAQDIHVNNDNAQPEWMMREVGFRTPNVNSAVSRNRGSDSTRVVDAGGFEPPATWLQTRCSSKLS